MVDEHGSKDVELGAEPGGERGEQGPFIGEEVPLAEDFQDTISVATVVIEPLAEEPLGEAAEEAGLERPSRRGKWIWGAIAVASLAAIAITLRARR